MARFTYDAASDHGMLAHGPDRLALAPRSGHHMTVSSRLPSLGRRGEGWVVAQFVLFLAIGALGIFDLQRHGWANPWGLPAIASGLAQMVAGAYISARGVSDLRPSLSPFPRPLDGVPLIDTGAYRLIRHPIYAGLVLAALGWGVATGSLSAILGAGSLFLLFEGKSRREEAWLVSAHPGYAAYKRRTRRFIPWIY